MVSNVERVKTTQFVVGCGLWLGGRVRFASRMPTLATMKLSRRWGTRFRGGVGFVFEGFQEEADGGYSGGSCLEAGLGVFQGDAAEGEDGGGDGGGAGGGEGGEAGPGGDGFAGGYFFEDRAEEDGVYFLRGGSGYFFEGVARDGDGGGGQVGGGVELADLGGVEFVWGRGEVDSVGGYGDGDIRAGVEEDFYARFGGSCDAAGGSDDVAG